MSYLNYIVNFKDVVVQHVLFKFRAALKFDASDSVVFVLYFSGIVGKI